MKYIIYWDIGLGEEKDIIEADSMAEAVREAKRCWEADVEANAIYGAEKYTEQTAADFGVDWEDEDEDEE